MNIEDTLWRYTLSVSRCANARVGAILTYKNTIVSFGSNSYKSHPLQKKYGKNANSIYLHAEIDAIRNALRVFDDLSRCKLWICRAKRSSQFGPMVRAMSRPCSGCQKALEAFGLKQVVYTTEYGMRKL